MGTLGIAHGGTTCEKNVFFRSSLNEYQGGDLNTGLVNPNCHISTKAYSPNNI